MRTTAVPFCLASLAVLAAPLFAADAANAANDPHKVAQQAILELMGLGAVFIIALLVVVVLLQTLAIWLAGKAAGLQGGFVEPFGTAVLSGVALVVLNLAIVRAKLGVTGSPALATEWLLSAFATFVGIKLCYQRAPVGRAAIAAVIAPVLLTLLIVAAVLAVAMI